MVHYEPTAGNDNTTDGVRKAVFDKLLGIEKMAKEARGEIGEEIKSLRKKLFGSTNQIELKEVADQIDGIEDELRGRAGS